MEYPEHDGAVTTLRQQPQSFLQPSVNLHSSFTQLAKSYLDPVAHDVTEFQLAREKHEREKRKRKRRQRDVGREREELLQMRQVYVGGFGIEQIWQQAKKVLNATADEIESYLHYAEEIERNEDLSQEDAAIGEGSARKKARFADDQENSEASESDDDSLGEEGVDWEYDGDDVSEEQEDGGVNLDPRMIEGADDTFDGELLDVDEHAPRSDVSEEDTGPTLVKDKFGLNDGFFSIDQFNKQSQFLEQVDARGESDDGAASDEEEIDWSIDPTTITNAQAVFGKSRRSQREDKPNDLDAAEESEDDEDGPTFGNMDLDAPEGESDIDAEFDEDDAMGGDDFNNTNDVMYKDFFAPPAQQPSKKKRLHMARLKEMGEISKLATEPGHADEDDAALERTISGVHRDLFDDDLSDDQEGHATKQDPDNSNLSSHERRQLALREEIRRLEAANVSAKPWSLTGESVALSRPVNSLLEEDLDFERAGKPVPVVTEEVSEDIEALVKRRILAREFDEVTRRRPTDLLPGGSAAADPRRGRMDNALSDAKPQKGLADEYAEDHLRATDPGYVDTRTAALQATHKSIEAHWASVSAQLDALCNWRYKPKPPAPSLEVRTDAPTISMEDARPAVAEGSEVDQGMLAPQEVWNRGMDGKREGEVVTRGGGAVAREEQTREQKLRRRRREKERIRKAGGDPTAAGGAAGGKNGKVDVASGKEKGAGRKSAGKKGEGADLLRQLKRGGVKVIGKKGAVTDVDGAAVKDGHAASGGAGKFKL